MSCPFCHAVTDEGAMVCPACSRDIGIPATLVAERDELLRKREKLTQDLRRARDEIEKIRRGKRP